MVTVKKISLAELPELIELSYKGDNDLFEKYHIAKMPFEDCVNTTMAQIKQAAQEVETNYYKVVYQAKPIGYIVTFNDVLYSFAINTKYRKAEILKSFWSSIKSVMCEKFACVLYNNNTRGIEWLERNGMRIAGINEENNSVTLLT